MYNKGVLENQLNFIDLVEPKYKSNCIEFSLLSILLVEAMRFQCKALVFFTPGRVATH